MIKIRVRYLGAVKELTGIFEEEIFLNDSVTLNQLLEYLLKIHPNLNLAGMNFMIAVNGRITTNLTLSLKDLDKIILSHIIAGG